MLHRNLQGLGKTSHLNFTPLPEPEYDPGIALHSSRLQISAELLAYFVLLI